MTIETIQPFLRYAHKLSNVFPYPAIACDHRIFYSVGGSITFFVGSVRRRLEHGSLLYIPAGTPYTSELASDDSSLFGLNFDFGQSAATTSAPIPPVHANIDEKPIEDEPPPREFQVPLFLPDFPEGERYLRDIEHEYRHKKLYAQRRASLLLSDLLLLTLRRATQYATPKFSSLAERVAAHLREHYNEPCDNAKIGEVFSYHPNYLNRLLVAYTGLSIHKYLTHYRIDRAVELLSTTSLSVTEVGAAVGFSDLSHFSKVFERITGYPPSAFQT